jgi:heme/copper-type cytochrome/quinol oxidase subunit 2
LARKLIIIAAGQAALIALFFLLRPALPLGGPQERTVDAVIAGTIMTPNEIVVEGGDRVTLRIGSNLPLRLHLHGYDLQVRTVPGETATLTFAANLTGRFIIEDEDTQVLYGNLVVRPRGER